MRGIPPPPVILKIKILINSFFFNFKMILLFLNFFKSKSDTKFDFIKNKKKIKDPNVIHIVEIKAPIIGL